MRSKKDYALCGWLIYYIILFVIMYAIDEKYSHAMLFMDVEKPFEWGVTPSVALYNVIGNYMEFLYLGLFASIWVVISYIRKRSITNSKNRDGIACIGLSALSNIASLIYVFFISSKYNEVLYEVNNPMVDSEGNEILMLNVLMIPIVLTVLGIIGMIASGFYLIKHNDRS